MISFKKKYCVIWRKQNQVIIWGCDRRFIKYLYYIITGYLKGYKVEHGEV